MPALSVEITSPDLEKFLRKVSMFDLRFRRRVARRNNRSAERLRTKIQANASGRPGPREITGVYKGSWRIERASSWTGIGNIEARVYTNHPAAWRLEKGFVGLDSMGRNYAQPPFVHVATAVEEVSRAHFDDSQKDLREAWDDDKA